VVAGFLTEVVTSTLLFCLTVFFFRLGDRQMRKHAGLESSLKMLMAVMITLAGAIQVANGQSSKTLYNLAKEKGKNGKYTRRFDATGGISYSNVEEIAKRSDAIIIGRPVRVSSYLTPDGASITTRCWLKLQEVVRGRVNRKGRIIVSVPGGSHVYQDRTIVSVRSMYYQLPQKGHVYVFFLSKDANDPKLWNVVGGSQGQFELILPNGEVQPGESNKMNPLRNKYENMTARQFLKEIRRVAR
jgi:hypothetical protein